MKTKIKKILSNNIFMVKFTWKYNKFFYLILFLLIFLSNIRDLLIVVAPKYIFDSMQNGNSFKKTLITINLYVLSYLIVNLIIKLLSYNKTNIEAKLKLGLNVALGEKFMKIDYSYLESNKSIQMFTRGKMAISGGLNDIQTIGMSGEQGISGFYDQLVKIISSITLLISVAFVFSYMELYMLFIIIIGIILNILFSLIKRQSTIKIREAAGPYLTKSRYCNNLLRTFEYGKDFRIFGMTDFIVSKFSDCSKEYIEIRNRFKLKSCFSAIMISVINNFMRIFILIVLIFKLSNGSIGVGDFSMIFAAMLTFSGAVISLLEALLDMNILSEFMQDYQKCIELEEPNSFGQKELTNDQHTIIMDNVSFQYSNSKGYALKNINVTLCPNEKVSIVGFNGAGKSTFINLLLGLYQPTEGRILIDGIDIKDYSNQSIRKYMGAVLQNFMIYALPIDENIVLNEKIDSKSLNYSMFRSGILSKVNTLDKREKSIISGFFERGDIQLSGGESQKIAMSRSFYRNTRFIALDEPTSSLDVLAENEIYENISNHSKDELLLFISHRLASTRFCERILVFNSGEIVESGTHKELLDKQGLYATMWNTQAEKFNRSRQ